MADPHRRVSTPKRFGWFSRRSWHNSRHRSSATTTSSNGRSQLSCARAAFRSASSRIAGRASRRMVRTSSSSNPRRCLVWHGGHRTPARRTSDGGDLRHSGRRRSRPDSAGDARRRERVLSVECRRRHAGVALDGRIIPRCGAPNCRARTRPPARVPGSRARRMSSSVPRAERARRRSQ